MSSVSDILVPDVFDTNQFAPKERFERWRDRLAPALFMERAPGEIDGYHARHESWNIGDFVFARETSSGGLFSRNSQLRRKAMDHWCLLHLKEGENRTRADSGIGAQESLSDVRPGDSAFYSLTQNCRGEMNDVSALTLFIPRDNFARQGSQFDGLNNSILSTPRARMLGDYLLSLDKEIAAFTAQDAVAAAEATSAMIMACLSPSLDRTAEAEAPALWLNRTRAGRYIKTHLDDPALTPDRICREAGVSRSVLYRIFEPAGGVIRYIRRARLHAAHRLLRDDELNLRVGEIAVAVGFADASDFSRAFKREFGYAPRDARAIALHEAFEQQPFDGYDQGNSLMSWLGKAN